MKCRYLHLIVLFSSIMNLKSSRVPLSLQFITGSGMSSMSPKWPPAPGFSWSAGTLSDAAHCSIAQSKRLSCLLCSWELPTIHCHTTHVVGQSACFCFVLNGQNVMFNGQEQLLFYSCPSGSNLELCLLRIIYYCVRSAIHILTWTIVSVVWDTINVGHGIVGHVQNLKLCQPQYTRLRDYAQQNCERKVVVCRHCDRVAATLGISDLGEKRNTSSHLRASFHHH